MKFCPNCGAKVVGAGKFCVECGENLQPYSKEEKLEEVQVEGKSAEELKAELSKLQTELTEIDGVDNYKVESSPTVVETTGVAPVVATKEDKSEVDEDFANLPLEDKIKIITTKIAKLPIQQFMSSFVHQIEILSAKPSTVNATYVQVFGEIYQKKVNLIEDSKLKADVSFRGAAIVPLTNDLVRISSINVAGLATMISSLNTALNSVIPLFNFPGSFDHSKDVFFNPDDLKEVIVGRPLEWWLSYNEVGYKLLFNIFVELIGGIIAIAAIFLAIFQKNWFWLVVAPAMVGFNYLLVLATRFIMARKLKRSTCAKCQTIVSSQQNISYKIMRSQRSEKGTKEYILVTLTCPNCGEQWSYNITGYSEFIDQDGNVKYQTPEIIAMSSTVVGDEKSFHVQRGISGIFNQKIVKATDAYYEKYFKNADGTVIKDDEKDESGKPLPLTKERFKQLKVKNKDIKANKPPRKFNAQARKKFNKLGIILGSVSAGLGLICLILGIVAVSTGNSLSTICVMLVFFSFAAAIPALVFTIIGSKKGGVFLPIPLVLLIAGVAMAIIGTTIGDNAGKTPSNIDVITSLTLDVSNEITNDSVNYIL